MQLNNKNIKQLKYNLNIRVINLKRICAIHNLSNKLNKESSNNSNNKKCGGIKIVRTRIKCTVVAFKLVGINIDWY